MKFSEFAGRLMPLFQASMSKGAYVKWLLESIGDDGAASVLNTKGDATLRAYLSGKRAIDPLARRLVGHLDTDRFKAMLCKQPQDVLDQIFQALAPDCPSMTADNVIDSCTDLYREIIYHASGENGMRPLRLSGESSDGESLIPLILKEDCVCPICGDYLMKGRVSNQKIAARKVSTYPVDARSDYRVQRAYEQALPTGCEGFASCKELALCRRCADDYESDPSVERYVQLAKAWKRHRDEREIAERAAENPLDEEIGELLVALTQGEDSTGAELSLDALAIDRKIRPDNRLLRSKITNYVATYYARVSALAGELDGDAQINFKRCASQVRAFYCDLAAMSIDQSELFDAVVSWIMSKSGRANREASEVLTAFFVQNCEVFDEISE